MKKSPSRVRAKGDSVDHDFRITLGSMLRKTQLRRLLKPCRLLGEAATTATGTGVGAIATSSIIDRG